MHELGIVFHIIKSVEEVGKENNVDDITKVTLEIGEVSGILEDYLQDCWKWAVAKPALLKKAELFVETIPAVTFCEDCEKSYGTVEHGRLCPYCGSEHTYLLTGNEVNIKEIEVYGG